MKNYTLFIDGVEISESEYTDQWQWARIMPYEPYKLTTGTITTYTGIVKRECEYCGKPTRDKERDDCIHCGGPLP